MANKISDKSFCLKYYDCQCSSCQRSTMDAGEWCCCSVQTHGYLGCDEPCPDYEPVNTYADRLYNPHDYKVVFESGLQQERTDVRLIYNKKYNVYTWDIRPNTYECSDAEYLFDLMSQIEKWMADNGYSIEYQCSFSDVFCDGVGITSNFVSVEEAYGYLKMWVIGFTVI